MAQRRKARRRSKEAWLVFENITRHIPIKFPNSSLIRNLKQTQQIPWKELPEATSKQAVERPKMAGESDLPKISEFEVGVTELLLMDPWA